MSKTPLIGPFFFEDKPINGESYLSMLQNFFLPEIRRLHKVRSMIFQQDKALPHFAIEVRQYLDHQFPHRWIPMCFITIELRRSYGVTAKSVTVFLHFRFQLKCNSAWYYFV